MGCAKALPRFLDLAPGIARKVPPLTPGRGITPMKYSLEASLGPRALQAARYCSYALLATGLGRAPFAQTQTNFSDPLELSVEVPGGAMPGGSAVKGKIVRLVKTTAGLNDGRLVTIYADANHTQPIWDLRDGERLPRDIFATYSSDDGETWSAPVNISNTAQTSSATTDWNADGVPETYWGDSEKPNVFAVGDLVVVTWVDAYMPEPGWAFGTQGNSSIQGRALYPDLATYPLEHEVPFRGVYAAISYDGGTTWVYGDQQPPIQLSYGERDAKQDSSRGAGRRWIITWQEDPEGLQSGEGDGPGEGGSGATASKGTDVWYTWSTDLLANPSQLRLNRGPLTNHSAYDLSDPAGQIPTAGAFGSIENHAGTRPNVNIVQDGPVFKAMVAYEETKGVNSVLIGKTVQYHCFPYDQPLRSGPLNNLTGDAGTSLTGLIPNSRRVRFVRQTPNGVDPAVFIFWKEGYQDQGGPSDIRGKVSLSLDPAAVAAAPTLNFSASTPSATMADMVRGTEENAIEDANAHRAIMRGSFIALGWCYTWNGPLARFTDLANYNFFVRRSFDGGASWDTPTNVSQISDTRITVREPRIVQAPVTNVQNDNVFVAAWGTVTNVYEGVTLPEELDVQFTRTADRGDSYEKIVDVGGFDEDSEFESQIQVDDPGTGIYFVLQANRGGSGETLFSRGQVETFPATVGTIYCIGDGTGRDCPCGNESDSDTGEGCSNSSGRGAVLLASGSTSFAANDLRFDVAGLPAPTFALLVHGTEYANGTVGLPLRDGLLCIGGTLRRLAIAPSDGAGNAVFHSGYLGATLAIPGDTARFQVIYRDSNLCAPGASSNSTNGLKLVVTP